MTGPKININGKLVEVTPADIRRMKNLSNRDKDDIIRAMFEGQDSNEMPYFPDDIVFSSMHDDDD